MHFIGQYWDNETSTFPFKFSPAGRPRFMNRKIREWTTLDWILNYTFNFPAPAGQNEVPGLSKDGGKNVRMTGGEDNNVLAASTAEYTPCGWRAWLNNVTITLGINNVFDEEPPLVAGFPGDNYDQINANIKGRFWYVALKKRF
jgi:outer membrane receptor protein involved in Fe transport